MTRFGSTPWARGKGGGGRARGDDRRDATGFAEVLRQQVKHAASLLMVGSGAEYGGVRCTQLTSARRWDYHRGHLMADAHGHGSSHDDDHGPAKGHGHTAHAHAEPPEDAVLTPAWMPLLGLGLLLAGALGVYLFLSPGVLATPTHTNAGDADVAADAAAP